VGAGHVADLLQLVGREFLFQSRNVLDDIRGEDDLDAARAVDIAGLADPPGLGDLLQPCVIVCLVEVILRSYSASIASLSW